MGEPPPTKDTDHTAGGRAGKKGLSLQCEQKPELIRDKLGSGSSGTLKTL